MSDIYRHKNKEHLVEESHILTPDISILLSKYFCCEKLAKNICKSETKKRCLYLTTLKFKINEYGIDISDHNLDLMFNTALNDSESKSFRTIRNKIVHECSLFYRNFAVTHKEEYEIALDEFIEKVGALFCK